MCVFSQFRYQDLLDIAICSYVMFRFYVLFRGTNAFTVLIGIAFLWLFKIVAVWSGLIVTSYAIQAITALAAIIIIVVFRNEIRNSLQATNLKTLLWGLPHTAEEIPAEIISEGVFELARNRIGGLIVFPGKDDLKDFLHSGIPFDAVVSIDSITSVFWKDNPIHDGAAVISGDRIKEVRAILPLTKRQDLPSHYGTRHRAAIGLAEQTDALVIVVSEERGRILAAKDAHTDMVLLREDLQRIIDEHTGKGSIRENFFQSEKFKLGFAALVSVVFITGAWLNLTKGLDTLTTLQIPIEYKNQSPKMEIVSTSVDSVRIYLKGSETLLKSIRPERLKVDLDIASAKSGENAFDISAKNITLPPGVTLKNVQPAKVSVLLDIETEKELPVQVDWSGSLEDDLILESVSISPQRIRSSGGSLVLEKIKTLYTEPVSLDPIKTSGSMPVVLAPAPPNIAIDTDTGSTVTITWVIKKR